MLRLVEAPEADAALTNIGIQCVRERARAGQRPRGEPVELDLEGVLVIVVCHLLLVDRKVCVLALQQFRGSIRSGQPAQPGYVNGPGEADQIRQSVGVEGEDAIDGLATRLWVELLNHVGHRRQVGGIAHVLEELLGVEGAVAGQVVSGPRQVTTSLG